MSVLTNHLPFKCPIILIALEEIIFSLLANKYEMCIPSRKRKLG